MERNFKKIGLINAVVLLLVTVTSVLISLYISSAAALVGSMILGLGLFVSLVSYFQMGLDDRERLEKLEFDELNKSKGSASLFTTDSDTFPARRSREQFEKFFVPAFTVLLIVLESTAIYLQWKSLAKIEPVNTSRATLAMSLYAMFGLILFLLGQYASRLARLQGERLLRPGAAYLLLSGYLSFALTGILAGIQAGWPQADVWGARVLCVLLGLIGIETLIGLVLEIYRPRVKGKKARLLYDSRLVGLLGQPEGLITTAAHALDYQFGFKVSETWFYRFLQRAFAWLILAQIAVLGLSTCIVFIEPGEQGLLERFGRAASQHVLEPGPHLKLPWPVERVYRYPTRQLQSFNIGFVANPDSEKEKTVVWTVPHYKEEFNLLVASRDQVSATNRNAAMPVNLLTVSIPVQYQIKDVRAFAYKFANSGKLLEKISTREVVRYLVGVDLMDIMTAGRQKAADTLRTRIQAAADDLELGVEIVFVGLQDIHPPVKVADAYEAVNGAQQDYETKVLRAEGEQSRIVPMAEAEGQRRIREAEAQAVHNVAEAQSRSAQFTNQVVAFAAAPQVYPQRLYLSTLARSIQGARKYILTSTNTHNIYQLNLEDKVRFDLSSEVQIPAGRK